MGLPDDRYSGIWGHGSEIHVRLRSRNHTPQGSLMMRACGCREDGDSRLCPVHCMALTAGVEGHQIFPGLTQAQAQHKLRRYLTMLSVPGATTATLKTFRASRATNLALQGKPLHRILQAGEWRSQALLCYANKGALDRGQILRTTLEHGDTEGD